MHYSHYTPGANFINKLYMFITSQSYNIYIFYLIKNINLVFDYFKKNQLMDNYKKYISIISDIIITIGNDKINSYK